MRDLGKVAVAAFFAFLFTPFYWTTFYHYPGAWNRLQFYIELQLYIVMCRLKLVNIQITKSWWQWWSWSWWWWWWWLLLVTYFSFGGSIWNPWHLQMHTWPWCSKPLQTTRWECCCTLRCDEEDFKASNTSLSSELCVSYWSHARVLYRNFPDHWWAVYPHRQHQTCFWGKEVS